MSDLRIGLIGAGAMGAHHARTLASSVVGAELVAVADVDTARAAAVAREVGAPGIHSDGREVIAASDVDALVVASSAATHEQIVSACLDAGKPVLCEKPLADSAGACRRLVEAEEQLGRRLIRVGFMRRYDEGYVELKRRLDGGGLGAVVLMHCVHRNADIPASFDHRAAITDSVVHEVDVARWLLGEEVAAVTVVAGRATRHAPDGVRDPQIVLLETESGVVVDVESFLRAGYGYDIRCEVVGENGTLTLASPAPTRGGFQERFAQAYRDELQTWVSELHAGAPAGPGAWDGYAASMVTEACLRSVQTGQRTEVWA